jgi:hypothetical protein
VHLEVLLIQSILLQVHLAALIGAQDRRLHCSCMNITCPGRQQPLVVASQLIRTFYTAPLVARLFVTLCIQTLHHGICHWLSGRGIGANLRAQLDMALHVFHRVRLCAPALLEGTVHGQVLQNIANDARGRPAPRSSPSRLRQPQGVDNPEPYATASQPHGTGNHNRGGGVQWDVGHFGAANRAAELLGLENAPPGLLISVHFLRCQLSFHTHKQATTQEGFNPYATRHMAQRYAQVGR